MLQHEEIPAILRDVEVTIPLRIDISHKEIRLIDAFCLTLNTMHEKECIFRHMDMRKEWRVLAERTTIDLDLPLSFASRIEKQIEEQSESYLQVITMIRSIGLSADTYCAEIKLKLKQTQSILLSIRHGNVEYEDQVQWNLFSTLITPESFAIQTVSDLKLPLEMGPIIAHRIREHIFRYLLHILSHPDAASMAEDTHIISDSLPSVKAIGPEVAGWMGASLWEKAKPSTAEDNAAFPTPLLPTDRNSNASVWVKN